MNDATLGTVESVPATSRAERSSNLELMRIVLMLLIVAHHSVVNSGILSNIDAGTLTLSAVVLRLWGMWGKTCINGFVLITGYFMCTKRLTWVKVAKLVCQVWFYKIVLGLVFLAVGRMTPSGLFWHLVGPLRSVNNSFVASFLVMYLAIPFMNALLQKLGRGGLRRLLLLLLWVQVFVTTFLKSSTSFVEIVWYPTLYFVAAYVRLYPAAWMSDRKVTGRFFLGCVIVSVSSVLGIMMVNHYVGTTLSPYYFVADSGKVMAFLTGLSCFLWFKNLRMSQMPAVNAVAATTFGVLCIHANSSYMRTWLWKDLLHMPELYGAVGPFGLLLALAAVMLTVFAVCSVIDWVRICLIEKPVFEWVRAHQDAIEARFRMLVSPLVRAVNRLL